MNAIFNRIWWGGDPDELNELSGLSRRDVYNVTRSWAVMNADAVKYGMQIFLRLFRINATAKSFFKLIRNMEEEEIITNFQFKAHVINLMNSIDSAVKQLHQPEIVIALMEKIGESHHKRKIQTEHFEDVKTVIVDILQNDLNVNEDVISSWARFVSFIYKHIFNKL